MPRSVFHSPTINRAISIITPLGMALLLISCGVISKPKANANKQEAAAQPAVSGGLGVIQPEGELRTINPASGLRPNISIEKLFVEEGDNVTKGQTIALLSGYSSSKVRLAGLEARYEQAQRLAKLTKFEADRYNKLVEQGASTDELKRTKLLEVEKTQSEVVQLQAEIANTKAELNDLTVVAPVSGNVVKLSVREGERIVPTTGLLVLAPSTNIEIRSEIYENNVRNIQVGDQAQITSQHNAFPETITGQVKRIGSYVESTSLRPTDPQRIADARIIKVIIAVPPQEDSLLRKFIGSTVNVVVSAKK